MFDDPRIELVQEPFISGIPAMIEHATRHIPDARKGFVLTFSRTPFPGYAVDLDWVRKYRRQLVPLGRARHGGLALPRPVPLLQRRPPQAVRPRRPRP